MDNVDTQEKEFRRRLASNGGKASWKDKNDIDRARRWGRMVFIRMYRKDSLKATMWATKKFGEHAKELVTEWKASASLTE